VDPLVTVHTGPEGTALRVPVVANPTVVADDVPFELRPKKAGEAQATTRGSVTPAAPGAGTRTPDVTSAFFEFDVEDGKDNASLLVGAVPSFPADIDLYLQRRLPDGTWSGDLAKGESGSLTEEQFRLSQPAPGRYRVEAHNWAGAPGTRVDLTVSFVNSAGEPGP
jgi:hypothetical protein